MSPFTRTRLSEKESIHRTQDLLFIFFAPNLKSAQPKREADQPQAEIENPKSFDHLVRPEQQRLRNRHANLLRRLQIDHQLELRR